MTATQDMFGDLVYPTPQPRSRHYIKQRGYAGLPGRGPAGMTCGDCQHIMRTDHYRKCKLNKANWTHGPASDILARAPACEKFVRATGNGPESL